MDTTALENPQSEMSRLLDEIERYLAAVDTFRAEGCAPVWRTDGPVTVRVGS